MPDRILAVSISMIAGSDEPIPAGHALPCVKVRIEADRPLRRLIGGKEPLENKLAPGPGVPRNLLKRRIPDEENPRNSKKIQPCKSREFAEPRAVPAEA